MSLLKTQLIVLAGFICASVYQKIWAEIASGLYLFQRNVRWNIYMIVQLVLSLSLVGGQCRLGFCQILIDFHRGSSENPIKNYLRTMLLCLTYLIVCIYPGNSSKFVSISLYFFVCLCYLKSSLQLLNCSDTFNFPID